MTSPRVTVVVLTYNEEENLDACLASLSGLDAEIYIVDSGSKDSTLTVAGKYTKNILVRPFINQADQLNWALENIKTDSEWILRLDADERLSPELTEELKSRLPAAPENISAFYFKRRVYFMGKWIRYGGYYPTWLLRVWRNGSAKAEDRGMDEHMLLSRGKADFLSHDILEDNKKDLSFWVAKHNSYASREAIEELKLKYGAGAPGISPSLAGPQDSRKRWLKNNIYFRSPLFLRAFLYFLYRYFFRLGFLDGGVGMIFHGMQGFWYRFLVDAKILEIKTRALRENKTVPQILGQISGA